MAQKRGRIISIDDIERKNRLAQRESMRDEIAEDVNEVISKIGFGGKKGKDKKKKSLKNSIMILAGIILLVIISVNIIFANIWLLKFFLEDFSKTVSSWFGK